MNEYMIWALVCRKCCTMTICYGPQQSDVLHHGRCPKQDLYWINCPFPESYSREAAIMRICRLAAGLLAAAIVDKAA